MRQTLVLGGPGAGKTTRLLQVMERHLEAGVPPGRIAFVTFTRAAAGEARTRARERFGFTDDDLVNFRTLHSLAFRELGMRRADVLAEEHLSELAEITGELGTRGDGDDAPASPDRQADALLTIDHYARTTRTGLRDAWQAHGGDVDWRRLERFSAAYGAYKADRGLTDFTDMLTEYARGGRPVPVDVAIVDEAQDLTLAQWAVADRAFGEARELWVGGDDDQSVHHWAGSADEYFQALSYPREVLPVSHRLPPEVFSLAAGVIANVSHRFPKAWGPAAHAGQIHWIAQPEEVDLSEGTWLLLARTRAQLAPLVRLAREQGVAYRLKGASSVAADEVRAIRTYEALRAGRRAEAGEVAEVLRLMGLRVDLDETRTYAARDLDLDVRPIWHDALVRLPLDTREYYLACLRRGESLTREPRVRIDTVHGSKGAEAENVLLDLALTWRTWRGYELDPDSEYRVLYVGVTRASRALWLLAPGGAYGYPI